VLPAAVGRVVLDAAATPDAARPEGKTMTTTSTTGKRGLLWAAGLVAAGALAGGVAAATLPASAQTSPSPSTTAPAVPDGTARGGAPGGQRAGETLLTGTNADKAKAAALKALPGATIVRLETDADGDVYEAHVTKADGTPATVKFDKDFKVTRVDTGMGHGGRGGAPGTSGTTGTSSTA
jgi:hypothetical protein